MYSARDAGISPTKRGRKADLSLPSTRSRDTQRAFRARRASHLKSLELRVMELESENRRLRRAMKLPTVDRPALGSGPTGISPRYEPSDNDTDDDSVRLSYVGSPPPHTFFTEIPDPTSSRGFHSSKKDQIQIGDMQTRKVNGRDASNRSVQGQTLDRHHDSTLTFGLLQQPIHLLQPIPLPFQQPCGFIQATSFTHTSPNPYNIHELTYTIANVPE
ncbi:hypothetical protein GALMADRAFT_144092 [Galerina marginata CBS 339.88]|uniref:BZIP domain-containing protein n=1 Tax=Galerina marginata (strain CBS 339.88) TaxID=685588 RepID=A0A067SLX5_GALM3|nr:hypothetical protein GALMADRAFT_144092 [Galerina marginata CBS 339.88]